MSPDTDTAITIGLFILILPGVVMAVVAAPFFLMLGDNMGPDTPRVGVVLVYAAVLGPPILVIGLYCTAAVLAGRASGPTFYYPLIALAVGVASWFGITGGIGIWIENLARQHRPRHRDPVKHYAVAGTTHPMSPDEILAELDGKPLDDRLGRRSRVALTPTDTPRRKRGLPRELFNTEHRTYVVHAGNGLPPGWMIERSEIPPWHGGPGGGIQYTVIAPPGGTASFQELLVRGFLEETGTPA